jgi:hypothetical protein
MAAYAEDLRRGDRAALAARYDPAGAHELRPGRAYRSSYDAIAAHYATSWDGPAAFEWRDLAYEVVSPDAVMVTGLFAWTRTAGGKPHMWSIRSGAVIVSREGSATMSSGAFFCDLVVHGSCAGP